VAGTQVTDATDSAFTVFLGGARVGAQRVTLSRTDGGWLVASSGQLAAPFDIVATRFEMLYSEDWQPRQLLIEGLVSGQPVELSTTFEDTTATNEFVQNGERASSTQEISAGAVVLPNNFFGAYEALAVRLSGLSPGDRVPVYVAPEAEISATVERVVPRRINTLGATVEIRDFALTMTGASGAVPVGVWVDAAGHLARIDLPAADVVVVRDELASVMAREEHAPHPGDEEVFIPSNGFSLAATVTKPPGLTAELPAVVFVAGPASEGRDQVVQGVPVVGLLAGAVADAGYFVVRYDPRGTGQSGGRSEYSGLAEYADDAIRIVAWLRRRDDVDDRRIAFIGYGEAAPIALYAAGRENRVKGLALVASPGVSGREYTLEQQDRALSQLGLSAEVRAERRALQDRVNEATITGKGWDGIPSEWQRRAETAWFKSWLSFEPEEAFDRYEGPVLIIHGDLDVEIPVAHADRLETLALARDDAPSTFTRKVIVAGSDHLLIETGAGQAGPSTPADSMRIAPAVDGALARWLPEIWGVW
jgi:pimeloyl-ACP methyl ester carboxylesterase